MSGFLLLLFLPCFEVWHFDSFSVIFCFYLLMMNSFSYLKSFAVPHKFYDFFSISMKNVTGLVIGVALHL